MLKRVGFMSEAHSNFLWFST